MHARLATMMVAVDRAQDALAIFAGRTTPLWRQLPGCSLATLLCRQATGLTFMLLLCDAPGTAAEAQLTSAEVARYRPLFTADPALEDLPVVALGLDAAILSATHAVTTRSIVEPAQLDAALGWLASTHVPAVRRRPGALGVVALADRAGGDLVTVSFWASRAAMEASEREEADEIERVLRLALIAPPVSDPLDVLAILDPRAPS